MYRVEQPFSTATKLERHHSYKSETSEIAPARESRNPHFSGKKLKSIKAQNKQSIEKKKV